MTDDATAPVAVGLVDPNQKANPDQTSTPEVQFIPGTQVIHRDNLKHLRGWRNNYNDLRLEEVEHFLRALVSCAVGADNPQAIIPSPIEGSTQTKELTIFVSPRLLDYPADNDRLYLTDVANLLDETYDYLNQQYGGSYTEAFKIINENQADRPVLDYAKSSTDDVFIESPLLPDTEGYPNLQRKAQTLLLAIQIVIAAQEQKGSEYKLDITIDEQSLTTLWKEIIKPLALDLIDAPNGNAFVLLKQARGVGQLTQAAYAVADFPHQFNKFSEVADQIILRHATKWGSQGFTLPGEVFNQIVNVLNKEHRFDQKEQSAFKIPEQTSKALIFIQVYDQALGIVEKFLEEAAQLTSTSSGGHPPPSRQAVDEVTRSEGEPPLKVEDIKTTADFNHVLRREASWLQGHALWALFTQRGIDPQAVDPLLQEMLLTEAMELLLSQSPAELNDLLGNTVARAELIRKLFQRLNKNPFFIAKLNAFYAESAGKQQPGEVVSVSQEFIQVPTDYFESSQDELTARLADEAAQAAPLPFAEILEIKQLSADALLLQSLQQVDPQGFAPGKIINAETGEPLISKVQTLTDVFIMRYDSPAVFDDFINQLSQQPPLFKQFLQPLGIDVNADDPAQLLLAAEILKGYYLSRRQARYEQTAGQLPNGSPPPITLGVEADPARFIAHPPTITNYLEEVDVLWKTANKYGSDKVFAAVNGQIPAVEAGATPTIEQIIYQQLLNEFAKQLNESENHTWQQAGRVYAGVSEAAAAGSDLGQVTETNSRTASFAERINVYLRIQQNLIDQQVLLDQQTPAETQVAAQTSDQPLPPDISEDAGRLQKISSDAGRQLAVQKNLIRQKTGQQTSHTLNKAMALGDKVVKMGATAINPALGKAVAVFNKIVKAMPNSVQDAVKAGKIGVAILMLVNAILAWLWPLLLALMVGKMLAGVGNFLWGSVIQPAWSGIKGVGGWINNHIFKPISDIRNLFTDFSPLSPSSPIVYGTIATTVAVGTITTTALGAFLSPLPTMDQNNQLSRYVTITKVADPGTKFEQPRDIVYTVTITAKEDITITNIQDVLAAKFNSEETSQTNREIRTKPASEFIPAGISTPVSLPLTLTRGDSIIFQSYTERFDSTFQHANVTNTITLTFDTTISSGETATTAEVVCFGKCPQAASGCWPASGFMLQTTANELGTHRVVQAVDIRNQLGVTKIYSTYAGDAYFYKNGTGIAPVYGNHVILKVPPDASSSNPTIKKGFTLLFGHLYAFDGEIYPGNSERIPIEAGQLLGTMGISGLQVLGPSYATTGNTHLHLEIRTLDGNIDVAAAGLRLEDVIPEAEMVWGEFVRTCYE